MRNASRFARTLVAAVASLILIASLSPIALADASADCTLTALASTQAFTPAFDPATLSYAVALPATAKSVSLTPTAIAGATFTMDGAAVATKEYAPDYGATLTASIVVTAADGTHTTTYTVAITKAMPDTSRLLSPGVSAGTLSPDFDPYKTVYKLTLPEGTPSVTFVPVKSGADDKMFINGSQSASYTVTLKTGRSKMVYIRIVTPAGIQRIYNFKVVRAPSANADLRLLSVNTFTALAPAFDAATTSYTLTVPEKRSCIVVTAKPADPNATVTINGHRGPARVIRICNSVPKTITIVVKAQAGNTKTYTITLAQPPRIDSFRAEPRTVTPGVKPLNFSYRLEGASDGTVMEIYVGGAWQQLMSRADTAGCKKFSWDGTVAGAPLTPGTYQVRLSAAWSGLAATPRVIMIRVK